MLRLSGAQGIDQDRSPTYSTEDELNANGDEPVLETVVYNKGRNTTKATLNMHPSWISEFEKAEIDNKTLFRD